MRFREWLQIQERKKESRPDYSIDRLLKGAEDLEKDLRKQQDDAGKKEAELDKEIEKKRQEKQKEDQKPIKPKPWDKNKNKPGDKTKPWERDRNRAKLWHEPQEDTPPWPKKNDDVEDDHAGDDKQGSPADEDDS